MNITLTQITIFKTFIKSDISTLHLTTPKDYVKKFENQKPSPTTQTPHNMLQSSTCSFTKYLYFLRYRFISTSSPQIFIPSKFELLDLKNPKISQNFPRSNQSHYPQPKLNKKSPKHPKVIPIFTMKQVYTYFWWMMPAGVLISVALISVAFSSALQSAQPPQIT